MSFTGRFTGPDRDVVRGKGTAYPVGHPAHTDPDYYPGKVYETDGTPEPVFHEVGPVNVPTPGGGVVLEAILSRSHIEGMVLRSLRLDPKYEALVELVEDLEPTRVSVVPTDAGWRAILDYDL